MASEAESFVVYVVLAQTEQVGSWSTDSAADTGRGTSSEEGVGYIGGVGRSSQGESMSLSVLGVTSGDGDGSGRDRSFMKPKGALWGRGEMSIESGAKPGDEEGIGGVVTPSHRTGVVKVPSVGEHVSTYASRAGTIATYPVYQVAERDST
jgi:hypothetical protein